MKKIVLAPDSFKGTLSSLRICEIMKDEILSAFPDCLVISLPIADGGEGTVDSFLHALPGEKISLSVTGPLFNKIHSFYGLFEEGKTAVIEMAAAAGLPAVGGDKNPSVTTTYGVGELIKDAVKRGARKLVVGLGGSCTNDGGCGLAAALGVKFLNAWGNFFIPVGNTLSTICAIDQTEAAHLLSGVSLCAMCDVDNPLFGENGAAYVFGPQKGADEAAVKFLDLGLRHFGSLIENLPGREGVSLIPGAGAAGGLGAGMSALLGAALIPGIDAVLDTSHFEKLISGADLILTGEGRMDAQSLRGKAVLGVSRRAAKMHVPVVAVVGDARDDEIAPVYSDGICAVFSTNRRAIPLKEAKELAEKDLRYTVRNIIGMLKALEKSF
ncbi:MAG: glycerate kinase [Bacillota bacterium]|nr:glycerate kinase [Bacillota bacterium]